VERITGTVQPYAWGSKTAIAALRGRQPSASPEAELWFGSHPSAPSRVEATGEPVGELPFLVKILAAAEPLSIQTHPNLAQAREGFAREEAAGLARNAPTRTYRDANHKPEIIIALTEFEALCGFRPVSDIVETLRSIGARELAPFADALGSEQTPDGIRRVLGQLLTMSLDDRVHLVDSVVRACNRPAARSNESAELVTRLHHFYPGDVGCVVALMLNHVRLSPGEAIFLDAGNLHAYIHGTGVEVMSTSDNVVRGGLTPKHIDVSELLRVINPMPLLDPVFRPIVDATPGVETVRYHPPVADFAVDRITLEGAAARWTTEHDEIIVCTSGSAAGLMPGDAALAHAGESITVRGTAVLWRVTRPGSAGG
jgi:mannose-6-phosphate isomerase